MKYSESQVNAKILRALKEMGFVDMTPIQEKVIPVLMEGRDVVGQAQTGTGKTASFGIPMIEKITANVKGPQGLVLCPTRELAIQVCDELHKIAKYTHGIKIVPIYGGQDIEKQIRLLKGNVSIVVGTPGRVMDHMRRRTLKFNNLKMLVLDEADEMLNMGFREDIETICHDIPEGRQMMLFSATMPEEILEIAASYQNNAIFLKAESKELTIPLVKQHFCVIKSREKREAIIRMVEYMDPQKALIFCNTKRMVDELTLLLKSRGYSAEALHGDLSQHQRDRVMNMFRSGSIRLLLATDVAARGLDVEDVDTVFNYDMPQDMEYYVHRIGRTGRAGKKGQAFSIITASEMYKIESLRDYCKADISRINLPSASETNEAKAAVKLEEAVRIAGEEDMVPFMQMVYRACCDEKIDSLKMAGALLRMSMGDLLDETKEEKRNSRKRNQDTVNRKNHKDRDKSKKQRPEKETVKPQSKKNKRPEKRDKGGDPGKNVIKDRKFNFVGETSARRMKKKTR